MHRRYWIVIVVMLFVSLSLCLGTAIDFRLEKYEATTLRPIRASIAKSDIPKTASREQIIYKLASIWMDSHRIGTLGWTYWLWDYKIGYIDATNAVCGTVDIQGKPFLPDDFTFWAEPYTVGKKYGDWYELGGFMALEEDKYYYYLIGPFSLC